MTQKDLLITLLEKLGEDWLPAQGLLVLVQEQDVKPEMIEALTQIILHALDETTNESLKAKLTQTADYLRQLHDLELADQTKEALELAKLEEEIMRM
jgi:hypothetical protein